MMEHFNLDFLVTLLLINKVESFRNSYSLTKILAWKVDIIQFVELIDDLQNKGLIKVETREGKKSYEMTYKGHEYLREHLEEAKPIILKKYSEEATFVNSLLVDNIGDVTEQ